MSSSIREVRESPLVQGSEETLVYRLTVSAWGSSPVEVQARLFNITGGEELDVSGFHLSGTPAVDGDVITLPAVQGLVPGNVYRLEVRFRCGANRFGCWARVEGEK